MSAPADKIGYDIGPSSIKESVEAFAVSYTAWKGHTDYVIKKLRTNIIFGKVFDIIVRS